jgi:hypothetical protein
LVNPLEIIYANVSSTILNPSKSTSVGSYSVLFQIPLHCKF